MRWPPAHQHPAVCGARSPGSWRRFGKCRSLIFLATTFKHSRVVEDGWILNSCVYKEAVCYIRAVHHVSLTAEEIKRAVTCAGRAMFPLLQVCPSLVSLPPHTYFHLPPSLHILGCANPSLPARLPSLSVLWQTDLEGQDRRSCCNFQSDGLGK